MKKIVSLALAGILAVTALAGCSGDDKASNPPASQAATNSQAPANNSNDNKSEEPTKTEEPGRYTKTGASSQGVTATSVKVGNGVTESGAYAAVGGPFIVGIQAYFDMINSAGGVDGRKIEYVHYDDHFDAAEGKTTVIKLVETDKVFALVGHFGTPVVAATLDDIKDYGIPAVYFATGIGPLFNDKAVGEDRVIMPVQPIYTMEGRVMATYAKGYFGASTVGVIYTTDEAGNNLHDGVKDQAAKIGLTVKEVSLETLATDATAQLQQLQGSDVVIGAAIQGTFPTIIKDMEKLDFIKPVITTYVNVSASMMTANAPQVQKLMKDPAGGIFGLGWVDASLVSGTKYVDQITKLGHPEYDVNAYCMTGWVAAHFFVTGLERLVGYDLTWENYLNAMEEAPIQNPFGGIIDFSDGKRLGTQDMSLSIMDESSAIGWSPLVPLTSMDDLLAGKVHR